MSIGLSSDVQSGKPAGRVRRRSALARAEMRDGYLMMAPWLFGFIVLLVGPMVASLVLSFTDWQMLLPPKWIGLQNYVTMFTQDDLIPTSLVNTAFYAFVSTPLYAFFGLLLGLLMNLDLKGVRVLRTMYFLPSITPVVAATLLWVLIFQPDFGLANFLVQGLGLPKQLWLLDPNESKPVLIFMYLWGVGGSMPIFLAGLKGIPKEMYEAAVIDGADRWSSLRYVTLPLLSPVLFFVVITGFIGGFQVFTSAFIATAGGPSNSTMFFVLYLYNSAFQFFKMGYASAMAWLLFVVVLAFTLIQFAVARRLVYYEESRD
ncbi:MAG TPA: sugar ABC transporter permease [Chloroflexota bacterium]|nr:sugar ABC transporter permease [Chloroflexota bacterium]